MLEFDNVNGYWQQFLSEEVKQDYFAALQLYLDQEKANGAVFYPPLDEDDGDPIRRLSALGYLSDSRFIINTLKTTPLAKSKFPQLGHVI